MEVSQMTNKLLQKIEELTLYTIMQEEKLVLQDKELKKLENKVVTQEEKLAELKALKTRMAKLENLLIK